MRVKLLRCTAFGLVVSGVISCQNGHQPVSSAKIVRGAPVEQGNVGPEGVSTVGLEVDVGSEASICSGVLIAADRVLTAGHCAFESNARISAYFGREMPRDRSAPGFIAVTQIKLHPDYKDQPRHSDLPKNDVAVLVLAQPAPAGYRSIPLLEDRHQLQKGQSVRLAGYGITEKDNDEGVLRSTESRYEGKDGHGTISTKSADGSGVCDGDSGGPLYAQVDGQWYVAGVVSGNDDPCGGRDTFASVPYYLDFIKGSL